MRTLKRQNRTLVEQPIKKTSPLTNERVTKETPKRHQTDTKQISNEYQGGTKEIPKGDQTDIKTGTKRIPNEAQRDTKQVPKRAQSQPRRAQSQPKDLHEGAKDIPMNPKVQVPKRAPKATPGPSKSEPKVTMKPPRKRVCKCLAILLQNGAAMQVNLC